MRKLCLLTLLAAAVIVPQQRSFGQQPVQVPKMFKELHRAEIDALLATPDKVLILDLRTPTDLTNVGAFPVFLSIQAEEGDTQSLNVLKHLSEIPRDRPIITVSGGANRASYAAALLASKGYTVLGAMGANAYVREGGQLLVKYPVPNPPARGTPPK